MNLEKLITDVRTEVQDMTILELVTFAKQQSIKQPTEMEQSTPKTKEKKEAKIDMAIARVQYKIKMLDEQIEESQNLVEFYVMQLDELVEIKNDKDLK